MPAPFARWLICLGVVLAGVGPGRALDEEPPPGPKTGTEVKWEGWKFRWAVRPREGLILTDVSFGGRMVLKYAGLEEIFVPYDQGQPRPEDSLDGMGVNMVELKPGVDCVPYATCQMFDAQGKTGGKSVVAMHEEPAGLVYMGELGRARGKMLVLWCMARLGNYTYITRWRFRDDGCLYPEAGLTGRLEHIVKGNSSPYGSYVGRSAEIDRVFAPSHVHNFYYRLDFDLDGSDNDVVEEFDHRQDQPGRSLTARDGWTPVNIECGRSLSGSSFRFWRVADRVSTNALGHRRSYDIMPGGNGVFRGGTAEAFTQADLYVTKFQPRELPLSSTDPRPIREALPTYLNAEAVSGADLVVWYVMHVHHIPKTEDWPAMPIAWAGFELSPRDFLDASPLKPQ